MHHRLARVGSGLLAVALFGPLAGCNTDTGGGSNSFVRSEIGEVNGKNLVVDLDVDGFNEIVTIQTGETGALRLTGTERRDFRT